MKRNEGCRKRSVEFTVFREGESACITYAEEGVPTHHYKRSLKSGKLTDAVIAELFNEVRRAQAKFAAKHKHIAIEVPRSSSQIKYSIKGDQWMPRGHVLRCLINNDQDSQAVIQIDDQEFQGDGFSRLLKTYVGWGMRIEIVPANHIHRRPALHVCRLDDDE